jgi:hypothetical protein
MRFNTLSRVRRSAMTVRIGGSLRFPDQNTLHAIGRSYNRSATVLAGRAEAARHKQVCFPAAWARYDKAARGNMYLLPTEEMAQLLSRDYGAMREMFFGTPPPLDELLANVPKNSKPRSGSAHAKPTHTRNTGGWPTPPI